MAQLERISAPGNDLMLLLARLGVIAQSLATRGMPVSLFVAKRAVRILHDSPALVGIVEIGGVRG